MPNLDCETGSNLSYYKEYVHISWSAMTLSASSGVTLKHYSSGLHLIYRNPVCPPAGETKLNHKPAVGSRFILLEAIIGQQD